MGTKMCTYVKQYTSLLKGLDLGVKSINLAPQKYISLNQRKCCFYLKLTFSHEWKKICLFPVTCKICQIFRLIDNDIVITSYSIVAREVGQDKTQSSDQPATDGVSEEDLDPSQATSAEVWYSFVSLISVFISKVISLPYGLLLEKLFSIS